MGGIYAQAAIRGGGEYGQDWRNSGIRERKPNAFDDFIAAASFLASKGYTRPDRLVFEGSGERRPCHRRGDQRAPDLCAVALPDRGVMDMLRYHLFKGGAQWAAMNLARARIPRVSRCSWPIRRSTTRVWRALPGGSDHDGRLRRPGVSGQLLQVRGRNSGRDPDDPVLWPAMIRIDSSAGHGGVARPGLEGNGRMGRQDRVCRPLHARRLPEPSQGSIAARPDGVSAPPASPRSGGQDNACRR
jgi:prolyl oligopeptidase